MAENTINEFNTLPEQVQINKEDIKTNTADITKLKDDINKIKPNAWEQRKISVDIGKSTPIELTTYNPITNQYNPVVNIQRAFTDKDTYTLTDAINSYSFAISGMGIFAYIVCADPSLTLNDLIVDQLGNTTKNALVFANTDVGGSGQYWLLINCRVVNTYSLAFGDTSTYITKISTDDDKNEHSVLTAKAVDQYYLKKTDASNTYLTKTDASNTYATKTELSNANNRIDALDTGIFDVDLTVSGLAKIKANVTIGTPITLTVNTDFFSIS